MENEESVKPAGSNEQMLSKHDAVIIKLRRAELNSLRGLPSEEDQKTESISETSTDFGRLELGSTYEWSESSSLSSPLENDIYDSIEAIREEAARIDTIMALDQLDTMKQELGSVKKILDARRMEVHDLRELVSLKDDLLCTMELERDLYKAEIVKLKDQLEAVRNATESDTEEPEATTVHVTTIAVDEAEPLVLVPEANASAIHSSERSTIESVDVLPANHRPNRRLTRDNIEAAVSETSSVDQNRCKAQIRSCLFVPRSLFRKKRRPDCRDGSARELGQLFLTSLDTNDELRKRIAMLSAYYENVVERMQRNLNEAHTERQRIATDLAKQIYSMDKEHRRTVEDLQRRLRQKERELAAVKEVQL